MSVTIDSRTYYGTREVCQTVGTSRATFMRWLSRGVLHDISPRDRRGRRLFTETDIKRIRAEVNKIQYEPVKR